MLWIHKVKDRADDGSGCVMDLVYALDTVLSPLRSQSVNIILLSKSSKSEERMASK